MLLNDRWNGADDPFEGDRELVLRHLPAGARVQRARATVVPVSLGQDPFVEILRFPDSGASGDRGMTRSPVVNAVEIDFHARRTLAGVEGSGLAGAALSVDLGGGYMPVGASGAVTGPEQPPFLLSGGSPALPGLTVTRFRLVGAAGSTVSAVRVKSVPSNLTLSLPGRPALWFHSGDLAQPETTRDFAAVLQAFLDTKAAVENGTYVLPLLLHSDTLARLQVELEVEYLLQANVLPGGLAEATLPFALDGQPRAGTAELAVTLPADARVIPSTTASRAKGSFEGTRVAVGPTADVTPVGTVDVAAGASPAQPLAGILPDGGLEIVAVDLRLAATTRTAQLQLDLREDDDGKPGAVSLLPAPVPLSLDRSAGGLTPWTSVALPSPFQFQGAREKNGWLVLQALDGEAAWSVLPAATNTRSLQRTADGGFSWRQAALPPPGPAALAGLFRLRSRPAAFTMPIALAVGSGAAARQVSLARFNPLGRIDLSLDLPEIAQGFNAALAPAVAAACPVGELLTNGDFSRWVPVGDQLGSFHPFPKALGAWIAAGPDGRRAYAVSYLPSSARLTFQALDLGSEAVAWHAEEEEALAPAGLAVRSDGTRAYVALAGGSVWVLDLAGEREVGPQLSLFKGDTREPRCPLALSPDGSRLYIAAKAPPTAGAPQIVDWSIATVDTAQLEAAITGGGTTPLSVPSVGLFPWAPVELAVAPDGSQVYVLAMGSGTSDGQADLLALDPDTLDADFKLPLFPASAPAPQALALTPDGATAVIVSSGEVSLVRLPARTVEAPIPVSSTAAAVAVEPNGARAFLATAEGITVLDLARRAVVTPGVATGATVDLTVTPQGDRILAAIPAELEIAVIPIGLPVPAEWTLTAGRVQPGTLPSGAPAALLGTAPAQTSTFSPLGAILEPRAIAPGPNALSQVRPTAAGCAHELRFLGFANVPDAVAELLWRTADGGIARTDAIPIVQAAAGARRVPSLHRAGFAAPAGATAVEVRFTVPAGFALLAQASLRADGGALADLAGGAAAWDRTPANPPAGFSLAETAAGTRLRNASPADVTLSQILPATAGAAFAFEIQGRALTVAGEPADPPDPRVEIHWQSADGTEVSPPLVLPVAAPQFDAQAAAGTVPPGARQAEVRLAIPAGAALEVGAIDLRFPTSTRLPVNFIAESPGELALLDWQVTYDRVPAPPPPVPAGGLPAPTPPARPAHGGSAGDGCCDNGSPAAAPAPLPTRTVQEISGIGAARARQLQTIGIRSLDQLARASPTLLKQAMPGVTQATAGRFVLRARELLQG